MRTLAALALLAATVGLAASAAGAGGAAGASRAMILAAINRERVANGLPAVRENARWSGRCRAHDLYMARTGEVGHAENMARPAASDAGLWAAENSVVAMASWADGNPYSATPLHLIQLMNPLLATVGVDEHGGFTCTTTWPGFVERERGAAAVYSYPGDRATGVPPAGSAAELGLDSKTGFNIMVWAVGLHWPTVTAAHLTGPGGARVALKTVDTTEPRVGGYLGPGAAFLIPLAPLAPGMRYTASVVFSDGSGRHASRTWQFTTRARPVASATAEAT